jgi:holo-[acyl-carrier protein] synthase
MILGIGTDIIEIERLKDKTNLFRRFLSKSDFEYVEKFKDSLPHIAGIWASKEALVKAMDNKTIEFSEISILHTKTGKPYFDFKPKVGTLYLSISHEKKYATAVVVWEK